MCHHLNHLPWVVQVTSWTMSISSWKGQESPWISTDCSTVERLYIYNQLAGWWRMFFFTDLLADGCRDAASFIICNWDCLALVCCELHHLSSLLFFGINWSRNSEHNIYYWLWKKISQLGSVCLWEPTSVQITFTRAAGQCRALVRKAEKVLGLLLN